MIYSTATANQLAFARITVFGMLLAMVVADPFWQLACFPMEAFAPIGALRFIPDGWLEKLLTVEGLMWFKWIYALSLLMCVLAFGRKMWSMTAALLLTAVYLGIPRGFGGHVNHQELILFHCGLLLLIFPCWDGLNLFKTRRSPSETSPARKAGYAAGMQAICFYIALTYLFIGLARLMTSGVKHLFDQSMVYYALYHSHRWNYWEMDMASDLLNQKWLQIFLIASFPLATLLEIVAPVAVFVRKLTVPIVLGLIVFHLAIFGFMNLLFWQNMLLLCLLLMPFFAGPEKVPDTATTRIVFFDGVCGLCNRFVKWLARWDEQGLIKFAPLQGQTAQNFTEIRQMGKPEEWSIYFAEGSNLYKKSEAVLRVCLLIPLFADVAKALLAIPKSLRDRVYEAVAYRRYAIFGKVTACELPSKEMQTRVLP